MSQIVLPREFDLETIRYFCKERPNVRFEVFVSGALCVSVSGVCFISELMTDRSANRGSCAQICRLPMEFYHQDPKNKEAEPELKASGHLLSMKDNLRLDHLKDIVEAGASSFKIEGRLKDKDFVINQVSAFREKLDEIIAKSNGKYERASIGVLSRNFKPNLNKTFNRGFTDAWLLGDNARMINTKTPKSLGEAMGQVVALGKAHASGNKTHIQRHNASNRNQASRTNTRHDAPKSSGAYIDMRLSAAHQLSNGDSFTYYDANGELAGFRVNRVERLDERNSSNAGYNRPGFMNKAAQQKAQNVAAKVGKEAAKGAANEAKGADLEVKRGDIVRLHLLNELSDLKVGDDLFRNVDTFFIKTISMPKVTTRKVALKACVELDTNSSSLSVRFSDELGREGGASYTLYSNEVLVDKPLSIEAMLSKLPKLGDDNLSLDASAVCFVGDMENAFLTISDFNNLRREALANYLQNVSLTYSEARQAHLHYLDDSLDETKFTKPDPATVVKYPDSFIDPRLILNETTKAFYQGEMGDLVPPPRLTANAVMTCRNCLIKNHAVCHEDGGSTRGFYLKIGKHRFDVVTNCRDCLMYLVPAATNPPPPKNIA